MFLNKFIEIFQIQNKSVTSIMFRYFRLESTFSVSTFSCCCFGAVAPPSSFVSWVVSPLPVQKKTESSLNRSLTSEKKMVVYSHSHKKVSM